MVIENLVIAGGNSALAGGCIYVHSSDVVLSHSAIENCSSAVAGGGIYVNGSSVVRASDTRITSCVSISLPVCDASGHARAGDYTRGGAIALDEEPQGQVHLLRTTIESCSAVSEYFDAKGGALHALGGSIVMTNSTVSNCQSRSTIALSLGGCVYMQGYTRLAITDSSLEQCLAFSQQSQAQGGAVYAEGSSYAAINRSRLVACAARSQQSQRVRAGGFYVQSNGTT